MILESLKSLIIPIDSVKLDPRNARKHPVRNLETIKRSLETYGQRKPIVVNSRTGQIEAGNGLWQAAKDLGWKEIAAVKVDDDGTTAKAYGLMDNQSALLAEWDVPVLLDLAEELGNDGTGFSDEDLEAIAKQDYRNPKLKERKLEIQPKKMLRILISVPVDEALEIKELIEQIQAFPGVEVDYGGN